MLRRTALAGGHVGDGVHRLEAAVGSHRAVADAHHEYRRPGEAFAHVGDHLLDLRPVAAVALHARLHDVESVLQHDEVVRQQGVDLGVDRRIGAEHRLSVVAADRVVVDADAAARVFFEDRAVAYRCPQLPRAAGTSASGCCRRARRSAARRGRPRSRTCGVRRR